MRQNHRGNEARRYILHAEIIAPEARECAEAMEQAALRTPNPRVGNLCVHFPATNSAFLCVLCGFAVGQNSGFSVPSLHQNLNKKPE